MAPIKEAPILLASEPLSGLSLRRAVEHVTQTNPAFELSSTSIRGVSYPVFKNAPAHLRAMLQASREVQNQGAADYLVYQGERWTYDQFCNESNRLAHALTHMGIRKGDHVAIAMRNYPEFLILMMAISSVGAVTVFLNAWWTTEELEYALKDSRACAVFADGPRAQRIFPILNSLDLQLIGVRDGEGHAKLTYSSLKQSTLDEAWPEVPILPDDDMAVMYSSGTTGQPKGVVLTHRGAISAVYTWLMQGVIAPLMADAPPVPAPQKTRPSILVVTPLFHITATHPNFLLSQPAGAKLVLLPKWDAAEAVRLIRDEEITRFLGVPTQSADLREAAVQMGERLPTLDFLGSGGAKRPATQVTELADAFPQAEIATGWGMTETNANGIGMAGAVYTARPGSAGRLYPPLQQLKIVDDAGTEVATGMLGEITVKSASNMRCYLNKPEATAEVLRDGWLRTGDLGTIDRDGYITIVDRKKNIIIRGGENIACLDVEGALHRHPAVAEAVVFPVPHTRLGEVVGAGIQIRKNMQINASDLSAFLAEHIAKFKIPDHFWLQSDPLPRGATDKIDRRIMRDQCLRDLETQQDSLSYVIFETTKPEENLG